MTRGHLRVIAAFVLLVSTRIVALPSQADKNGDIDITQSLVKPHVVSLEGANNENRGSSVSPLSDKKLVVQQVEQSESKAKISSIVPPARASLNMGANDVLTLSFNVEASGIKRVRFFLELNGLGTSKYVIRSAADTYTLTLRGVPAGTSSWSIEIVTNSSNEDLKNQKFGPWAFSVQTGKQI